MLSTYNSEQLALHSSISDIHPSPIRDPSEQTQHSREEGSYKIVIENAESQENLTQNTTEDDGAYEAMCGDYFMASKMYAKGPQNHHYLRKMMGLKEDAQMSVPNPDNVTQWANFESVMYAKLQDQYGAGNYYDDDALSVGTAVTDNYRSTDDDNSLSAWWSRSSSANSAIFRDHMARSNVMFTIQLENEGQSESVNIYEDEDYEHFLELLCERYNMTDKAALPFKINLMNMIIESHPDSEKFKPYLNKLLELNYNLVMSEIMLEKSEKSSKSGSKNELEVGRESSLYEGDVEDFSENSAGSAKDTISQNKYLEDLDTCLEQQDTCLKQH